MVNVFIDEITPCLKDIQTGDFVETEVIQIKRKSFLQKYNKKNGWYINWSKLLDENEVYALVVKGTVDIQGMVALKPVSDYQAVYVTWMCSAPANNKMISERPKYAGVGGHLFAIAAQKSCDYLFGGAITGFAANEDLLRHYCKNLGADPIRMLHQFQFFIDEKNAEKIMEVYDYEWTDDEL